MYQLFIVLMMSALIGTYVTIVSEQRDEITPAEARTLALNLAMYRTAVIRYVQSNPNAGFRGSVSNSVLPDVGAYVPNTLWRNYVSGSTVVVYAASLPGVNIVGDLESIAYGSVFAGAAYDGTVVADPNAVAPSGVSLPAAVAGNIPNGAPVWEALDVF
ncbi:pilus assembly protein PilM [Burkholderia sp. WAC0059]|uniref:type IV pilus biogenesis protein PilM n=1 Tax=Burkholderia sp. WAC0059 TaxID=2066022 RepID=UPI000C7E99C7|nr:type IV pilus biogenesis protein PilM [Burkholderia sp. WAC0059]PLY99993.1 pilus assembly protein PilM [Burkholderia sp. WAC0059]